MCPICTEKEGRLVFPGKLNTWKNHVERRDGHVCQICFKVDVKLNAHHIFHYVDYPEKRFDIDNGITLCFDHHVMVHRMYKDGTLTHEMLLKMINDSLFHLTW